MSLGKNPKDSIPTLSLMQKTGDIVNVSMVTGLVTRLQASHRKIIPQTTIVALRYEKDIPPSQPGYESLRSPLS